ncbi:hypothetical protein ABZ799_28845 [Nocardiopsis dassonvillei]|uniref:hypothetical protein n=1 Tax=Nocardiopsis dassonvillei TaxID=2014 RepID=UPI0033C977B8
MTYTTEDRRDIAAAGRQMTRVLADIAHHEVGNLAEGWQLQEDTEPELARLRTRMKELADVAAEGLRELREIELRAKVRRVWTQAFETGRVEDASETDPGQTDQLNVHGVANALANAETEVDAHPLEMVFVDQMTQTLDLRCLQDQILDRILDTEFTPGQDTEDQALENARVGRAADVVSAFVIGVYGEAPDKFGMRMEVDSGPTTLPPVEDDLVRVFAGIHVADYHPDETTPRRIWHITQRAVTETDPARWTPRLLDALAQHRQDQHPKETR